MTKPASTIKKSRKQHTPECSQEALKLGVAAENARLKRNLAEQAEEQDFYTSGPNQKWASDITHLRTDEGWLYLAVVIDLWSRVVIGWSMPSQLIWNTLQMALWRRKSPENVIVRTGREGQYCSANYQALLKRHNLRGSMSAKGLLLRQCQCGKLLSFAESGMYSRSSLCQSGNDAGTVFNYIECDYNCWRRHSSRGGFSPEQFEYQNLA